MNKNKNSVLILLAASFLFWSCDLFSYGKLGGADQTDYALPGDPSGIFEERMDFLCGIWYSHYAGIGRLDGYRIRKWSDFSDEDRKKALEHFPDLDIKELNRPRTYITADYPAPSYPKDNDYIVLYDDTAYGQREDGSGGNEDWGFCYMGLVRAINIFNGDKNRGSIIIHYFEEADPRWLYSSLTYFGQSQGLSKGEKPFFGIYYRVLSRDIVQMANAVDLAAMYAGKTYYTEKRTLQEAIDANTVENEAEFISWGVVIPQDRAK